MLFLGTVPACTVCQSLTGVLGRGGGGLGFSTIPLWSIHEPILSTVRHLPHGPDERHDGQPDTLVVQYVQQGWPFEQKNGWWYRPTIMLRQIGHSNSDTTMAFRELLGLGLVVGDSSAVK